MPAYGFPLPGRIPDPNSSMLCFGMRENSMDSGPEDPHCLALGAGRQVCFAHAWLAFSFSPPPLPPPSLCMLLQ